MIKSFKSKAHRKFWTEGDARGLKTDHVEKIALMLAALNAAQEAADATPHPDFPMPHPGQLLADDIAASGENKSALSQRLGVSRRALYDILEGKTGISATMALRLESVLGSSAEFWLGLQSQYDLWKARKELKSGS